MAGPIFDSHAHYQSRQFDGDRQALLESLPAAGVGAAVIPGVDAESSRSALALAERRPWLFAAVGFHPEDCAGCTDGDFDTIRDLCRHEKVVAIGEIGLDYYWAENPPKEFQQTVFRRQLELALELDLPVIVHDREAHGDCLEIVREFPGVRGVFHCFSGSLDSRRLIPGSRQHRLYTSAASDLHKPAGAAHPGSGRNEPPQAAEGRSRKLMFSS